MALQPPRGKLHHDSTLLTAKGLLASSQSGREKLWLHIRAVLWVGWGILDVFTSSTRPVLLHVFCAAIKAASVW